MARQVRWAVEFYTDARGGTPALQFLSSLPHRESAIAARALKLLGEFGLNLGMPHVRPVADLWELRAGPSRFFYFAHTGRRFIILHGYRKQSQKAPRQEIDTAQRRMRDFLERES